MKVNGYLGRRERVIGVSSGANHAAIICESRTVYMFGNDEFGQLGSGEREDVSLLDERTALELRHSARGKRRTQGKLIPHPLVWEEKKQGKISKVWCTANATYIKTEDERIYVCGLNNGGQLGLGGGEDGVRTWRMHEGLSKKKIKKIEGGSFHGMALTEEGKVLTWGRADYCGVGKTSGNVKQPVEVEGVKDVVEIAAGSSHCVACDKYGDVFTWGFGETYQLGNYPRSIDNPKEEEPECKDELKPYRVDSKQLKEKFVFSVGAGAQHSVELAWDGEYAEPVSPAISMSVKKRRRESAGVAEEIQPVTKRPKH
jgi:alpha-tubulin suppressor-like RCC1 family protein